MKISEMSVEYVDHMGDDSAVCDAARVSFNKTADQYTQEQNKKLIKYLAVHNHWSPFSHCFVKLRVKAPIFIARQCAKHVVGLAWNEVSRRYVDDEPEFWFPKEWRGKPENAKQGSNGLIVNQAEWTELAHYSASENLKDYQAALEVGMAPEQARMFLPLNTMTTWIWSGSLAAFARVCKLRLDPHAQIEIQELAGGIQRVVEPLFPVSWAALMENE